MNLRSRFTILTASAVMVAGTVVFGAVGAASAAPSSSANGTISSIARLTPDVASTVKGSGTEAQNAALAAYWTPSRMRAAKPDTELPSVKALAAKSRQSLTAGPATKPQGPAERIAGVAPAKEPAVVNNGGVSTDAYLPNYPVGHPTARTNGKVFFTSFGVNYVCSAAIVNSEGRSSVWTAGHCVSSGGAWNYNWVFVPNYYSGVAPYGYWYAWQLWTTTTWFNNNSAWAYDVGTAIMYRNSGYRITDYFGGHGIAWNYPIGYYMYAFGYPHASPFNGCCLYAEANYTYDGGGSTIYMLNNMTGGSSGGPWLNWFDGNWGYINGHNDFKYTAYPQYMFSPYYGNQVASLYNDTRNISA